MNFEITNDLLDTIKQYAKNATVTTFTDNEIGNDNNHKSDYISVDEKNYVGFEVLDGEIIAFYFTDHTHFEDYSSNIKDGDDYIKRAKAFIISLFTNEIKHIEIYKGKKLAREKYYFVYSDNTEELITSIWRGLESLLNPFAKRTEKVTIYKFDKEKSRFDKK